MEGTRLGPYVIERELGSGGMGRVYAATVEGGVAGLARGTRVALKIVHPHLLETPAFLQRFLREAEIGRSVRHPNVVRTFDCDTAGESHFIAMEYVEGQTLRDLLIELERVPEELCRHVGREVARGLAAIHDAGAIHRDVKPDNVLITADHVVKVMDLGVARLADEALRLSQTGAFVGSLLYAAPECFQEGGKRADRRVDLHALGIVLYELTCGVNPYFADDMPRTIHRVLHEDPRRLGDANPQLSPFFEEVVHTLLAKDPAQRFASAGEIADVLDRGEDCAWWRNRAVQIRSTTKRPLRRMRVPRETAVYGRQVELALLRSVFASASAGEGQVVLVEGEAGIGKSRLVDALIAELQADGDELNFLFGGYPPGGAATAAGGFSTAFREHFGDSGCGEYLATTPVLAPAFDALLRGEPTPSGAEPLAKDSLQTCFVNATRALAAERTTVVLIDDLHFAPSEGRALFTALAMASPGHRILLVGTTRPGVPVDWLAGVTHLEQTRHLVLSRLGPKDLFRLLRDSLGSDRLAHDLSGRIAMKSDGNPFFVFEILRGLREGQFITQQEDGTWVGTKVIDEIQIPSSVVDLVNARVADLDEAQRDLLDVASCWGYEFDPTLIGAVCGFGRIPSLKLFGHIERTHRLVRSVGRAYEFDHHQVQEALHGRLNQQLREEYHAALAEALETRTNAGETDPESIAGDLCVDLCEHYLLGARVAPAVRYLARATSHLREGYLHAKALSLSERALGIPGLLTGTARAEALLDLCRAADPLGLREQEEDAAREAEQLAQEAGDDALRGRAARVLGGVLWGTSRVAEAAEAVGRALECARASGDRRAEAAALGNLGLVHYSQGRLAEAYDHHERALGMCREVGHLQGEGSALGNLGLVLTERGDLVGAQRYEEQRLALCRRIGDLRGETDACGNLGAGHWMQGRMRAAQESYARQLALSRETGYRRGEGIALGGLAVVLQAGGRLDEARELYEQKLKLCSETGNVVGEAIALHNVGQLHLEQEDPLRAAAAMTSCIVLADRIGDRELAMASRLALGCARADSGDEPGARESLGAAREMAVESGDVGAETVARCCLATLPGGDVEDALASVAEHEERLDPPALREARWLLWQTTGDRTHLAEAKRLVDESVADIDEETRASMLTNLRRNREILAAWHAESGDERGDPAAPPGAESETRVRPPE